MHAQYFLLGIDHKLAITVTLYKYLEPALYSSRSSVAVHRQEQLKRQYCKNYLSFFGCFIMSYPQGQSQNKRHDNSGRIILLAWQNGQSTSPYYYYADDLPYAAKLYTVLTILGSILSTPLILICCIPTINSIKKV